jgi:hypothetical protein
MPPHQPAQFDLTCFYACSYAVGVLVRVGGSLQTVVKMFTHALRTFAYCVGCWRGDQRGGQYEDAEHKWQPVLRYRHFSLSQSSRFTAGAAGFLLLIQCRERPET